MSLILNAPPISHQSVPWGSRVDSSQPRLNMPKNSIPLQIGFHRLTNFSKVTPITTTDYKVCVFMITNTVPHPYNYGCMYMYV